MGQCKHFSWQLSGWLKFMQAHATFLCGSPYHVWWADACQLWKTHGTWMGPCKGCAQDVLRLLLANSSSSATSVHWHHRSMHANCKKTYVAWMGLCDGLHLRLFQANSRSLAILVHLHHRPMQAFLSAAIWLTEIYVGPCNILVWQPISCLVGQCMLIVKKTYVAWMGLYDGLHLRLFLANSRLLATPVHLHHGPMRAFLLAAIWLTEIYAGPCNILIWQPILCLMGQCMLIVKKPMLHKWAHVMACTWDSFRPTWGHWQHQCILHHGLMWAFLLAAIWLTEIYAGPCDILVW